MPTRSLTLLLAAVAWTAMMGQEWTRFRGPNGTGISRSTDIPVSWTEDDFRWRVPIPGISHSQPVIWGERLFLVTATKDSEARILLCLRKHDGAELWRKTYRLPSIPPKNKRSSFANSSPVVDARRVVACFVSRDHFLVKAFDHEGHELWSRDLGPYPTRHGHGGSPIIHDHLVIVNNDQDKDSFVVALDLETGSPAWKLPGESRYDSNTYGTPFVHAWPGGSPELILTTQSRGVVSLEPGTGAVNWEAPVFQLRTIGSPVVAGDLVVVGWGFGPNNVLTAIRRGGSGDVSHTHVAYRIARRVSYVPSPLYHDGRLYLMNDAGVATALSGPLGRHGGRPSRYGADL